MGSCCNDCVHVMRPEEAVKNGKLINTTLADLKNPNVWRASFICMHTWYEPVRDPITGQQMYWDPVAREYSYQSRPRCMDKNKDGSCPFFKEKQD